MRLTQPQVWRPRAGRIGRPTPGIEARRWAGAGGKSGRADRLLDPPSREFLFSERIYDWCM